MPETSENGKRGLEIELKFELTAAHVRALCQAPAFKAMQQGRARSKTLRATYFDTPDEKLAKRGLALRVRKESRRHVQCFKAKVGAGDEQTGFDRHEWEWLVPGPDLDTALLKADTEIKALLKGVGLAKLQPVYSTDMKRQSRELHTPGGAVIACDIDQGRVIAGDREVPVYELELELKSGPLSELLRIAESIVEIVPARLSSRTKAHRGCTLARDLGHPWVGGARPPLSKRATGEDVLRLSMSEGLSHLLANEDCVLSRSHIEGVHQMRIALRRMRSVITTYKKHLPKGRYEVLSQALKDAGSHLGAARDWDVFLGEILPPVEQGFENHPDLAVMRQRAQKRQDAAYQEAHALIRSPEYAEMLTRALVWVGESGWRDPTDGATDAALSAPARTVAKAVLAKRHQRLLKAGKGLRDLTIEQRHALRIAVKKARYAAQFFADLYPAKSTRAYLQGLKALQNSLGHLNDLAAAERMMGELARAARGEPARALHHGAGLVEGWYMHAQTLREGALAKAWRQLQKADPFW